MSFMGPPKMGRYHLLESVSSKTFTPREYQVELLDAARKHNTIVCLGTGAGKTFVAVMLIKELAYQTRKPLEEDGKRTIFLVPTVPLVHQQAKVVRDYTDLQVAKLYGSEISNDIESWRELILANEVIVSTPDIFRMLLHHGYFSVSQINLLIFDECHRAIRNHAFCDIMQCFDVCPLELQPRVLGLSASLITNKCKPQSLSREISQLECVLKSIVETASALTMLSKYGSKPEECIIQYNSYSIENKTFESILKFINSGLIFLDDLDTRLESDENYVHPSIQVRRYLVELSHVVLTLGPWCTWQASSLFVKEICSKMETAVYEEQRIYFALVLTIMYKVSKLCEQMFTGLNALDIFLSNSPPKLKTLLKLLGNFKPATVNRLPDSTVSPSSSKLEVNKVHESSNSKIQESLNNASFGSKEQKKVFLYPNRASDDTLCCLIFVRQRITAYLLNLWLTELSKHSQEYKFISSSYIIGHGKVNTTSKDISLQSSEQEDVLRKFKSREFNVIVTTSVVEEGLDIPKCNLVIRFDTPENFSAYVQSKGRARAIDSSYILMVNSDEKNRFLEEVCDYKTIEQMLLEKAHKCDTNEEITIDSTQADILMEPYMPVKEIGAPRVTLSSAISLVNRYCAKLPSDTFTRLTPKWKVRECAVNEGKNQLFQCIMQLPINSPLKMPIPGVPMKSKQLAKMATALKTCEELHKIGELDDNLLPTGKEAVKFERDYQDNFESETWESGARPGTTKRRQYYFKQVADAFNGFPVQGEPCYLYYFHMELTCPIPDEQNTRGRKIHDPAVSPQNFGIVLSKFIPAICSFPVFTRSGEVTVYPVQVSSSLYFDEDQLESLSFFHKFTFSQVLRLEKYPMKYNPSNSDFSFYVVPVNTDPCSDKIDINWDFVKKIYEQRHIKARKLTTEERQSYEFRVEDYVDAVVMPWYRNLDKPQFFYVAELLTNLTPLSQFPDEGFETFKGYYEKKYSISIVNSSQPLLDVDHTSARLNLLTPRYVNRKGVTLPTSSESTKRTKRENLQQKQILVPELCIIHPFPASLWRKAVCLPCILYRMNSLLLSEQLRSTVAKEISVGFIQLPEAFKWPTLDFGWTLADVIKAQTAIKEDENSLTVQNVKANKEESQNDFQVWEQSVLSEDVTVNNSDFEIDVFDPSKYTVPDYDDEALVQRELEEINLLSPLPYDSFSIWQRPDKEPGVRYGSPSNFESGHWHNEWEKAEDENTNFHSLDFLPGIGYISAPGIFNMESLSLDLTKNNDILWEEVLCSDEEFEEEEETEENQCANPKQNFENSSQTNQILDMSHSEWLSFCSIQKVSDNNSCQVEDNTIVEDCSFENTINEIRNKKKNEIRFLSNDDKIEQRLTNSEFSFDKVLSAVEQINHFCDIATSENVADVISVQKSESQSSCSKFNKYGKTKHSSLPFGELLPNREVCHEDSNNLLCSLHFDESPDLSTHPGPSSSLILQAFTMSNANDGINLERLETVGDSFLKYAITAYLYCMYPTIHEGKLSFLRSKQISNLNLYRLGRRMGFAEVMVATKFEPDDNWMPPGFTVPKGLEEALIESGLPNSQWNISNMTNLGNMTEEEIRKFLINQKDVSGKDGQENCFPLIPYNLLTQHSIPDKSIADCVEALIGAYLVSCGSRGALLFMSWLGLHVLPTSHTTENSVQRTQFGHLESPPTPLLSHVPNAQMKLEKMLSGYAAFEQKIGYIFKDKAYLLQAFTHASYYYNTLTDCYQRLEFLGDAVLDYLITRHLYEDPKKHSPGTLTDLRSALVNNTFFASLAVKYDFHKYFKAISPSLFNVINKFVHLKEHSGIEDYADSYYLEEGECEEMEEVEVPKALGDIFESVAGALYLDSNMSLDTVWKVYYAMMKPEIEYFSSHVPKSPIRELLELEPQTAKFEKAEMTLSGKVRVRVEVFGKGHFLGVGRNKRIAKCTAAKRALRELKQLNKLKMT